jgi:predicted helicase
LKRSIGDYLNRGQKLHILQTLTTADPIHTIPWQTITPNTSHDWINQRNTTFQRFTPMGDKSRSATRKMFELHSSGVKTNRDAWCYNFSREALIANIERMIDFYNQQVEVYALRTPDPGTSLDGIIDTDPEKISWTHGLKENLLKKIEHHIDISCSTSSIYRPFCRQSLYLDKNFVERPGQMPKAFPGLADTNSVICVTGPGSTKDFSALLSNTLPDLELVSKSQCFPLYTYSPLADAGPLFQESPTSQYTRNDNITDETLTDYQTTYQDLTITKTDIFYYIYGILHSPEYKTRFAADLKKMLPRIPHAADFWAFSTAGRNLAHWHLHYETIDPYPLEEQLPLNPTADHHRVEKMTFAKKGRKLDKTVLHYNSHITLSGIPLEAYDYQVCDRSAIEWIMDRYRVKKDRASGIINDPNTWSEDPRYILDLLKRIVRVSMETVEIVKSLPDLNELESSSSIQLEALV